MLEINNDVTVVDSMEWPVVHHAASAVHGLFEHVF